MSIDQFINFMTHFFNDLPQTQLNHPWLLLLIPLPLLVYFFIPAYQQPQQMVRVAFLLNILKRKDEKVTTALSVSIYKKIIAILCWFLLVLAISDPVYIEPPKIIKTAARDLLLVIDVSGSMDTKDMKNQQGQLQSRLQAVQNALIPFVTQRKDDRIGLVIFGSNAFPLAPFTQDTQALIDSILQLRPAMAGEQTAIGDAIGVSLKLFEQSKAQEKIVVFLTDGKDTHSSIPPNIALQLAVQKKVIFDTIAIGDVGDTSNHRSNHTTLNSQRATPYINDMTNTTAFGGFAESNSYPTPGDKETPAPIINTEALKNNTTQNSDAENPVDLELIKKIANDTGGQYYIATEKNSLNAIYKQINQSTPLLVNKISWAYQQPLYFIPLILIALILTLSWIMQQFFILLKRRHSIQIKTPDLNEGN